LLVAVAAVAGVVAFTAPASGHADEEAAPIFGVKIPPGYRDWRLISVAHEEGNLNDLRAILGNHVEIKAYREGNRPFPDGTTNCARIQRFHSIRISFGAKSRFPDLLETLVAISDAWSSWSRVACAQSRRATRLRYAPTVRAP
jgi:hypothetical protein